MPHTPTSRQAAFLLLDCGEVFCGGAGGGGKLIRLNEPIPTPFGWKRNGDLIDGDLVLDEMGKPCRVLRAFAAETPHASYRLEFDGGSMIDAGAEHQWRTFDPKE